MMPDLQETTSIIDSMHFVFQSFSGKWHRMDAKVPELNALMSHISKNHRLCKFGVNWASISNIRKGFKVVKGICIPHGKKHGQIRFRNYPDFLHSIKEV